jgi:hypothetical protein
MALPCALSEVTEGQTTTQNTGNLQSAAKKQSSRGVCNRNSISRHTVASHTRRVGGELILFRAICAFLVREQYRRMGVELVKDPSNKWSGAMNGFLWIGNSI